MTTGTTVPLKAYRSALRSHAVLVWTLVFWPIMALAAWLVGDPIGGEVILVEGVLLVLPVLFVLGRPATLVLAEGIRVVPYLGRAKTYPWAEIEDIRLDQRGRSRHGVPIYDVRMFLAGDRRRWLPSLANRGQAVTELNSFRQQQSPPPAILPPQGTGRPRLRLALGSALLLAGLLVATAGIGASLEQTRLENSGVVAQAAITEVGAKTCHKYSCSCPMSWRFTDASGSSYTGSGTNCSSLYDEAEIGVLIPVIYDPTNPTINQANDRPPEPAGPAGAGALFAYFILGAGVAAVLGPLRSAAKRVVGARPAG